MLCLSKPLASSIFSKHFSGGMKGAQTDCAYYCTNYYSLLIKAEKQGWRETVNMGTIVNISDKYKQNRR